MMEELAYLGEFLIEIVFAIMLLGLFVLLISVLTPRKSQEYRKLITDMYVAAKTRYLAKQDGLDLEKEERDFKAWEKKKRVQNLEYDLDKTIESELKERVSEPEVKY
jgi:hypothetical protein